MKCQNLKENINLDYFVKIKTKSDFNYKKVFFVKILVLINTLILIFLFLCVTVQMILDISVGAGSKPALKWAGLEPAPTCAKLNPKQWD